MATITIDTAQFRRDIQAFQKGVEQTLGLAVKKIVLEAYNGVTRKTPRDTGRCAASWMLGIGGPDTSVMPAATAPGTYPAPSGPPAGFGGMPANGIGEFFVTNNLDYAIYLEEGTPKMAPHGMVRITFEELRAYLARAFV